MSIVSFFIQILFFPSPFSFRRRSMFKIPALKVTHQSGGKNTLRYFFFWGGEFCLSQCSFKYHHCVLEIGNDFFGFAETQKQTQKNRKEF